MKWKKEGNSYIELFKATNKIGKYSKYFFWLLSVKWQEQEWYFCQCKPKCAFACIYCLLLSFRKKRKGPEFPSLNVYNFNMNKNFSSNSPGEKYPQVESEKKKKILLISYRETRKHIWAWIWPHVRTGTFSWRVTIQRCWPYVTKVSFLWISSYVLPYGYLKQHAGEEQICLHCN